MKKLSILILCFACSYILQAKQTKVLWIGNSYVYTNDLPTMFHDLALSGGDTVVFDSYAVGGYTLQQQSQDATTLAKINSQQWDFVIIQAQSQEPSFPVSQFNVQTLPYAIKLDSLVHHNNACTQTVFYMTWGKKHGDTGNCPSNPSLCTFDGVTNELRRGYDAMTDTTHAIMAPVGMAWQERWHTDTTINLWISDDSHPLPAGTYLAACTFYATIFRKSPIGLSYSPLSPQWVTDTLQLDAYHTVFDSLNTWSIGKYDSHAALSYTLDTATKTVDFSAAGSVNYTTAIWDFGDNSAASTNGLHTYADTGSYTVKLVVANNCKSDSVFQVIYIADTASISDTTHTGIQEIMANIFSISPNPVGDAMWVTMSNGNEPTALVEIYDAFGSRITTLSKGVYAHRLMINVAQLAKGVYLLKIQNTVQRFVKL